MNVTFSTKTWQGDYKKILLEGGYDRKWQPMGYNFDHKWLVVNNIDDPMPGDIFTKTNAAIIPAEGFAVDTLDFFGLNERSFGKGYWYSIAELVELFLADKADYLCHFASDVVMYDEGDWITPAIEIMETDKNILAVSPRCRLPDQPPRDPSGLTHYFSDHCYLIPVAPWRRRIYEETGWLKGYPDYGDNSFEHMAGKYLHASGHQRLLLDDYTYTHPAW